MIYWSHKFGMANDWHIHVPSQKEYEKWAKLSSWLYAQHLTSIYYDTALRPAFGLEDYWFGHHGQKAMQMTRNNASPVNLQYLAQVFTKGVGGHRFPPTLCNINNFTSGLLLQFPWDNHAPGSIYNLESRNHVCVRNDGGKWALDIMHSRLARASLLACSMNAHAATTNGVRLASRCEVVISDVLSVD
jgi:hypothetical protein